MCLPNREGDSMATRRQILTTLGAATLVGSLPAAAQTDAASSKTIIPKRTLGRTGRLVTPLALGGQAALMWTPDGVDPADIIVRAVELGVNYLDTSNLYADSQLHYGEAFRRMNLIPGKSGYNAALREHLYLASKTRQRFGNVPDPTGATAVTDLKRSLSQIFGDGKGAFPEGAYLDCIQMHDVTTPEDLAQAYTALTARGGKMPEKIGTFATLLDYRDGTNYTGLNPDHHSWVRHIGITGHWATVLIEAIRRDEGHDLDTLLTPLNVCDMQYIPTRTNLLPLAMGRGMGVIAMKVFADGILVGKERRWTRGADDLITSVGDITGRLDYHEMIRYTLSQPGVSCAVIGISHIDRKDPRKDQLVANLAAAIDTPMTPEEWAVMDKRAAEFYHGNTNSFQQRARGLEQPTDIKLVSENGLVAVSWQSGCAGVKPILSWRISSGGKPLLTIPFREQLTMAPLKAYLNPADVKGGKVEVVASETA